MAHYKRPTNVGVFVGKLISDVKIYRILIIIISNLVAVRDLLYDLADSKIEEGNSLKFGLQYNPEEFGLRPKIAIFRSQSERSYPAAWRNSSKRRENMNWRLKHWRSFGLSGKDLQTLKALMSYSRLKYCFASEP